MLSPITPPTILKETVGTKLRRLAKTADATNPLTRGVMASPPTIGNSATQVVPTLVGDATAGLFRVIGATDNSHYMGGSVTGGCSAWGVEFMTDSQKFELFITPTSGSYFRFLVDGVLTSLNFTNINVGNFTLLDFTSVGGRQMRRIRAEGGNGSNGFYGVNINNYDFIGPVTTQDKIRAVFMGDSLTGGTDGSYMFQSFPQVACKYLGWDDPWPMGVSGSGYLAAGSGVAAAARLSQDCVVYNPDVVVFALGVNDMASYSNSQIQAAVTSLLASARSAMPNAVFYVLGPWYSTTYSQSVLQATSTAIGAGMAAGDPSGVATGKTFFLDNIAAKLLTGTGSVGSPASNGNCDWYMVSTPHVNQAGYNYYGRWLAEAIRGTYASIY